jgi:hypothetical protein
MRLSIPSLLPLRANDYGSLNRRLFARRIGRKIPCFFTADRGFRVRVKREKGREKRREKRGEERKGEAYIKYHKRHETSNVRLPFFDPSPFSIPTLRV